MTIIRVAESSNITASVTLLKLNIEGKEICGKNMHKFLSTIKVLSKLLNVIRDFKIFIRS